MNRTYLKPLPTAVNDPEAQSITARFLAEFQKVSEPLAAGLIDCIDITDLYDILGELDYRLQEICPSDLLTLHCEVRIGSLSGSDS